MNDINNQLPTELTVQWEREERGKKLRRMIRRSIGAFFLLLWPVLICLNILWIPALGLMLFGAILMAPDVVKYFSNLAGGILWSHRKSDPAPLYGIAESLVAKGLYEEAEHEYEKIIREFPGEIKPHIDMINIAVVRMNDGELAEKLFQRGMSLVKDPARQKTLSDAYNNVISRLRTPANVKTPVISADKIKATKERLEQDWKNKYR